MLPASRQHDTILMQNKFVIAPPIDRFRQPPILHLLTESLELTDCPKCCHIMLPSLFCDHCKLQYERRFINFESRLVVVSDTGELQRSVSSGSQVVVFEFSVLILRS
jgi:hypothetical protein